VETIRFRCADGLLIYLVAGNLGKGERVKQTRGWVETRDVDRGKGKAEKGICFSFQQKSGNRTGFYVFYELIRFYTSLTRFDRFYWFSSFKLDFTCFTPFNL
jgi:hypothetical protein